MKVRFTRPALDDLSRIHAYISKDNPAAASRRDTTYRSRVGKCARAVPGARGRRAYARVVVMPRFRYYIFYVIEGEEIHITHIRHTSRRRPWDLD